MNVIRGRGAGGCVHWGMNDEGGADSSSDRNHLINVYFLLLIKHHHPCQPLHQRPLTADEIKEIAATEMRFPHHRHNQVAAYEVYQNRVLTFVKILIQINVRIYSYKQNYTNEYPNIFLLEFQGPSGPQLLVYWPFGPPLALWASFGPSASFGPFGPHLGLWIFDFFEFFGFVDFLDFLD